MPSSQSLTTQQATALLGVSRATLDRLLDQGKLPFEGVGSQRRVLRRDALAYREQRRQEQYEALAATSVPIDEEADIETTLQTLREVRKEVAARRRGPR